MNKIFIARIKHHVGQLEFVLALCKCLHIGKDELYIQLDKDMLSTLSFNEELKSIFETEYPRSLQRLPSISRLHYLLVAVSARTTTIAPLQFACKLLSKITKFILDSHFSLIVGRLDVDELFLVNDPFCQESTFNANEVYSFHTQISPSLITYGVLASALVIKEKNSKFKTHGYFASPSLSSFWTDLLYKNSTFSSASCSIDLSKNDRNYLLLAYRDPSHGHLTLDETRIALEQIRLFLSLNPSYKLIYRRHPRNIKQENLLHTSNLIDIVLGKNIEASTNHLRVLASKSVGMISFSGTAVFEGIVASCPVLELITSDPVSLSRRKDAIRFSNYNLALPVYPRNLCESITSMVENSDIIIKRQFDQLNSYMPNFENINLTQVQVRQGLSELVRRKRD